MPVKLFVSCVGDLADVGGSVLALTSFRPLFLFARLTFLPWLFAYAVAELEFLKGREVSKTHEGDAGIWTRNRLER
jgi:hypothetical protein